MLTVTVQKQGFELSGQWSGVLYNPIAISLNSIRATTGTNGTTESLTLTFNSEVYKLDGGLIDSDILFTPKINVDDVTPGAAPYSYIVKINGITKSITLGVDIVRNRYRFDNSPQSVNIVYGNPPLASASDFRKYLAAVENAENKNVEVRVDAALTSLTGFKEALKEFSSVKVNLDLSSATLTGIPNGGFDGCDNLVGITLPTRDEFISIGNNAFNGTGITSIVIPDNITEEFGDDAFKGCNSLEELTLNGPEGWETDVFKGLPKLKKVIIGGTIEDIPESAFEGCSALESVTIGASVTGGIAENAFKDCVKLATITIPATLVGDIDEGAFSGCTGLRTVVLNGGEESPTNTFTTTTAFAGLDIEEVYIGGVVTVIAADAFKECKKLVSVDIGSSVRTITGGAFEACDLLKDVSIAEGVEEIEADAFKDCKAIQSIVIPSTVTTLGAFISATDATVVLTLNTVTLNGPTTATALTTFDSPTFAVDTITNVILGPGFGSALTSAFFGESAGLVSITVDPANAKYTNNASDGVLYSKGTPGGTPTVTPLTLVKYPLAKTNTAFTLPNAVVAIGNSAFKGAASLESLTINSGLGAIPTGTTNDPFIGCTKLETLNVNVNQGSAVKFGETSTSDILALQIKNLNIGKDVSIIQATNYVTLTKLEKIVFGDCKIGPSSTPANAGIPEDSFVVVNNGTVTFAGTDVVLKGDNSFIEAQIPNPSAPPPTLPNPDAVSLKDVFEEVGNGTFVFSEANGWSVKK
jgi:hypothetical protein